MNLAQKVLYNVGAQTAGRVATLFLALLSVRVMTGYLGVDGYGKLATILAVTALLGTVAEFGIPIVLTRELASGPDRADQLGGTFLRIRIATTGLAVALAMLALPFLPYAPDLKLGMLIALGGAFFLGVGRFPAAFFQVNLRLDLLALLDIAYKVLSLGVVVAIVVLDLGFYAIVVGLTLAGIVWTASSLAASRRFWRINLSSGGAGVQTRQLLRDSMGIWLFTIFGILHFQGDAVLLSLFTEPADVGIYTIAYRFVEQSYALVGILMAAVFPILVRRIGEGREQAEQLVRKTFAVLLLIGIPMCLVFVVLGPQLVTLVAGPDFDAAVQPLRVLAVAIIAMFATTIYSNVLIALKRQRELIIAAFCSLVLNMALNLYLMPRYSYMGAAWATLASETFAFALIYWMARRASGLRLGVRLVSQLAAPTALAALIVALLQAFGPVVVAVAALASFMVGVLAARVITAADLRLVLGR